MTKLNTKPTPVVIHKAILAKLRELGFTKAVDGRDGDDVTFQWQCPKEKLMLEARFRSGGPFTLTRWTIRGEKWFYADTKARRFTCADDLERVVDVEYAARKVAR